MKHESRGEAADEGCVLHLQVGSAVKLHFGGGACASRGWLWVVVFARLDEGCLDGLHQHRLISIPAGKGMGLRPLPGLPLFPNDL